MTTNNDALREAKRKLDKYLSEFTDEQQQKIIRHTLDHVLPRHKALAASKPEPQAQAGERVCGACGSPVCVAGECNDDHEFWISVCEGVDADRHDMPDDVEVTYLVWQHDRYGRYEEVTREMYNQAKEDDRMAVVPLEHYLNKRRDTDYMRRAENLPPSSIRVGDYEIRTLTDGSLWIEHESGEGMQVTQEILHGCIRDFYSRNF